MGISENVSEVLQPKSEKKIKIGFITPPISECGGVQRVLSVLVNHLAAEYEILIISLNDHRKNPYYETDARIRIIYYDQYYHSKWRLVRRGIRAAAKKYRMVLPAGVGAFAYYPRYMTRKIEKILQEEQCDCIIASTVHCAVLLGMIAGKLKATRLIGWHHNSFYIYFQTPGQGYYIQSKLAEKALKRLDRLVTLTRHDAQEYKKYMGIDAQYIYNPLSIVCKEKSDVSKPTLLFVSRLKVRQKGIDLLLSIAEILFHQKGYNGWKLKIIGGGEEQEVRELISRYDLEEQIELLGEKEDVETYYKEASIFLSTSRWEGFGMVVTEAMECGLPVVSFKTDGPSEIIIDGENGFLIDNYDLKQYADAVEKLMCDRDLRLKMSENAVERAKEFSPEEIVEQWKSLILVNEA